MFTLHGSYNLYNVCFSFASLKTRNLKRIRVILIWLIRAWLKGVTLCSQLVIIIDKMTLKMFTLKMTNCY